MLRLSNSIFHSSQSLLIILLNGDGFVKLLIARKLATRKSIFVSFNIFVFFKKKKKFGRREKLALINRTLAYRHQRLILILAFVRLVLPNAHLALILLWFLHAIKFILLF